MTKPEKSTGDATRPDVDEHTQPIQINENTVEDPDPPENESARDELHGRSDFEKVDQALQINDNTVDDKEGA